MTIFLSKYTSVKDKYALLHDCRHKTTHHKTFNIQLKTFILAKKAQQKIDCLSMQIADTRNRVPVDEDERENGKQRQTGHSVGEEC